MAKHALVEHVQAIKTLLAAVIGTPSYQKTLESQANALSNAFESSTFSLLDAAAIAEELKALPQQQQIELTAKLMDRVGSPAKPASAGRLALQDFTNFCHYLTESTWAKLQSDELPHGKLEILLLAAVRVGLRNPSETSVQHLCAMHLLMSEGKSKSMQLTPAVKLECARNLKAKFKSILARMTPALPTDYVLRLPVSVVEFAETHAVWHTFAFKDEPPVPTRIQVAELHEVMCSVPMRASRSDSKSSAVQMHSAQQLQQQQQQMPNVNQLMQLFAQMANQQRSSPQLDIQYADKSALPERRALQRLHTRLSITDPLRDEGSQPSVLAVVAPRADEPQQLEQEQPDEQNAGSKKRSISALEASAAVAAALTSKKEEKKEEKAKQADKSEAKVAETKTKPGKPKAKAKSSPAKTAATAKAKAKSSTTKQAKTASKPASWCYERSRNQILCRTGRKRPCQSKVIPGTRPASVKSAQKWLQEHGS